MDEKAPFTMPTTDFIFHRAKLQFIDGQEDVPSGLHLRRGTTDGGFVHRLVGKIRSDVVRRGQVLEYLTLVSCGLEAVVSIAAGLMAGSVALVGFGVDSVIEVTSGVALLWRLHHDADIGARRNAEQTTLRIVGACFLALPAYIVFRFCFLAYSA